MLLINLINQTFLLISIPNATTYANKYHSSNVGFDGVRISRTYVRTERKTTKLKVHDQNVVIGATKNS
jgi:hypothetical protein